MLSIKAVTTDSPNVMIKFRRRMAEEYNHMITLPCALHVANTFCKDICKIYRVKSIVKRNCAVVNFFVASYVWFSLANEWAGQRANKYSFQFLCESRWYSMVKVCLSIGYYKDFLKDASVKAGTMEEFPPIREDVLQYLTDRHFADNSELLEIIKPLADLIGELEKAKTNLADITI